MKVKRILIFKVSDVESNADDSELDENTKNVLSTSVSFEEEKNYFEEAGNNLVESKNKKEKIKCDKMCWYEVPEDFPPRLSMPPSKRCTIKFFYINNLYYLLTL